MKLLNITTIMIIFVCILLLNGVYHFQNAHADKGTRIVGSMKEDSRTLVLVQNASPNDIYGLMLESFSGTIVEVFPITGWNVKHDTSNTVTLSTDSTPILSKNSIRFYIQVEGTDDKLKFKWNSYDSSKIQTGKGAFSTRNIQASVKQEEPIITQETENKYPILHSSNGDTLTQIGYIWNKDTLKVDIVLREQVQSEGQDHQLASLAKSAFEEWQYKLRKASNNERAWNFVFSVYYEGKLPDNKADITVNIGSGHFIDYLAHSHCITTEHLKYTNEEIPFIQKYTTPINISPYMFSTNELGTLYKSIDELKTYFKSISDKYNVQTDDEALSLASLIHEKFEHGTISYCDINIDIYNITYDAISPKSYKTIMKQLIGSTLGLNVADDRPSTLQDMDIMTKINDMYHLGWEASSVNEYYISDQDVNALLTIYGNDGFGGTNNNHHPLPDCIVLDLHGECKNLDNSNAHQLEIELSVAKPTIKVGETQKISVHVLADKKPVSNEVFINCEIINSDNVPQKSFTDVSDNGEVTFTWLGRDVIKSDTYTVKCMTMKETYYEAKLKTKQFYFDGYNSITFDVTQ